MVSQPVRPPDASSRDRLLAAAAGEFAARGFDGAKVDRIARRARVNKAMLYYHFTNKAALYREILADLFRSIAAAVVAGRQKGGPPDAQIRRFIRTIAAETAARPHVPPIWIREIAEGGRHLDAAIVSELVSILRVLAAILDEGRRDGTFRPVHPLVIQMGIVAPLLFFAASAEVRERFQQFIHAESAEVSREAIVDHVERATLSALIAPKPSTRSPSRPPRRAHQPRPAHARR